MNGRSTRFVEPAASPNTSGQAGLANFEPGHSQHIIIIHTNELRMECRRRRGRPRLKWEDCSKTNLARSVDILIERTLEMAGNTGLVIEREQCLNPNFSDKEESNL